MTDWLPHSKGPDLIWLRFNSPQTKDKKNVFASWSVDCADSNNFAASIKIKPSFFEKQTNAIRRLGEISKLFAGPPAIVAAFPSGQIVEGFEFFLPLQWANKINSVITPQRGANNMFLLAVMSGEYAGRYGPEPFRMAVPTLLFAVSGVQEEKTKSAVIELINLANWKYRVNLALNPVAAPVGKYQVYSLEPLRAGDYSFMQADDWPAFVFYNDWFLLASNSAILKKLLSKYKADNKEMDWFNWAESRKAKAFVWIEPDSGWRALRLGLTASVFMLERGRPSREDQLAVNLIKSFRSFLENMNADKSCAIWFEEGQDATITHFELRHRQNTEKR